MNNPICPQCGKEFECGSKAGKETCWCFSFPKILSPNPSKECFCAECLERIIEQEEKLNKKQ